MQFYQESKTVTVTSSLLEFTYHCDTCTYDIHFPFAPHPATEEIGVEVTLRGKKLNQEDFARSPASVAFLENEESPKKGSRLTVTRMWGELDFVQEFFFPEGEAALYVSCGFTGKEKFPCQSMTPVAALKAPFHLAGAKTPRLLYVPYDNDKWIRYEAQKIHGAGSSYEVTAVYDDDTRNGYVIGSLTHDHWKTGIKTHGGFGNLEFLRVVGGIADFVTRDEAMPHGPVWGKKVFSPTVYIGYHEDFREGFIAFGNANSIFAPRLPWDGGVPFGWNSWACAAVNLDFSIYDNASTTLQSFGEKGFANNGTVFVNFDAAWSRLTPEELRKAVENVHSRGQKAGIYFAPFACWVKDFDCVADYTDGKYTYRDLLARDSEGNHLPPCDNGYPLDPTHPGSLMRVRNMMQFTVDMGFDYIKTDFMSHGACECVHYNPETTTGMEAYCYALKEMLACLDPKKIGRTIFLDFSIAPIFPYQFCHARRVSCDAFGLLEDTEYLLNSITYGFWQNNTIYSYNDPDHTVMYHSFDKRNSTVEEARSRLNASVIGGTVLLLSDDYRVPEAEQRVRSLLDSRLLDIARAGRTFLPVETATGDSASRLYTRVDEDRNLLAVFNLSDQPTEIAVDVSRLTLPAGSGPFTPVTGGESYEGEHFTVRLAPADSVILEQPRS